MPPKKDKPEDEVPQPKPDKKRNKPDRAKVKAFLNGKQYRAEVVDALPEEPLEALLTIHGVTHAEYRAAGGKI